jgi:hypothetical protein
MLQEQGALWKQNKEASATEDNETNEQENWQEYQALGGTLDESSYQSVVEKMKSVTTADAVYATQAAVIARAAGMDSLGNSDSRVIAYSVLRSDTNTAGEEHHHSQMSDQKLFAEALRIQGDKESLDKLIVSHPHIFSE